MPLPRWRLWFALWRSAPKARSRPYRIHYELRWLQGATVLVFAYLCAGELLPLPAIRASGRVLHDWAAQQVVLLATLSCLAVLLASLSCSSSSGDMCIPVGDRCPVMSLLAGLNFVPLVSAAVTTHWFPLSDNCPVAPGEECSQLAILLDAIGLVSARLARLDLGICVLLAAKGDSSLLLVATHGWLGYVEAMPLHRAAGWWCAAQSALHSLAYLLFYPTTGGLASLWRNCFPAPLPDGRLNRLGLVNGLGLLALLVLVALVLAALPPFRRRCYHVFQRLHLPLGLLFVACCALHDLPILLFAIPGLADWYLGRRTASTGGHVSAGGQDSPSVPCSPQRLQGAGCRVQRLPATVQLLRGTSGPWVELTVESAVGAGAASAPRGQWVLLSYFLTFLLTD